MKKFFYAPLYLILLISTSCSVLWKGYILGKPSSAGYVSPLSYTQWRLVWQDEFNGNTLDTTRWNLEVNDWGGGNEELQYYTARRKNAYVDNGMLVIAGRKEHYLTREYTSARLNTKHKGDWQYGRFDVRARLPKGHGVWPAIWMLPSHDRYGPWPRGGEIDIAEVLGREPSQLHGTVHFGNDTPQHRPSSTGNYHLKQGDFSEQFHVFSIEWDPDEIRWYLDNRLYHTARVIRPLDEPYHLLLNLAIGGKWPGHPRSGRGKVFPSYFLIDYVRVFERDQRSDLRSAGMPPAAN